MWVFSIYTIVDGFFVAKFVGEQTLSAINVVLPFINGIFSIAILFSTGTATLVGISLGENNHKKANALFTFTTVVELLFSIFLYVVCRLNIIHLASFLGATPSIADDVTTYLKIILLFNSFFIISYNLEVLVKTDGFPALATIGVLLSAFTNIFLDYLFVGVFHWGISGAAWATGIAQVFSTALFMTHFLSKRSVLKFRSFEWDFKIYGKILFIGFGSFISEISTGVIIFLYNNHIVKVIGETGLISYTVLSYINLFVSMSMIGLTQGMQPLVSYYYGKKDPDSYHKFLKFSFIGILGLSATFYIITLLFRQQLTGIFIRAEHAELFAYTQRALFYFAPSFLLIGFNLLISGYFASIGYAKHSLIIAIARGFLFIWIALSVATYLQKDTLLWLSSFFSELITLLVSILLILSIMKKKNLSSINKEQAS